METKTAYLVVVLDVDGLYACIRVEASWEDAMKYAKKIPESLIVEYTKEK